MTVAHGRSAAIILTLKANMMKITFAILILVGTSLSCSLCYGQNTGPTPLPSPQNEATIYVYRNFYHVTFGKEAPEISANGEDNGEELAVLDEGRYFVASLTPGFLIVTSW